MAIPVPQKRLSLQDRLELGIKHFLRRFGIDIRRAPQGPVSSETAKVRGHLSDYCRGNGVDLGPGGDPITPAAVRVDLPEPYTEVGSLPVQLGGDASDLYWFKDNCLDYVFSSHLLEDFEDTEKVLREWLRVLKINGYLIIFCPDEQRYRAYCTAAGSSYNYSHVHENFSLKMVKDIILAIGTCEVVHEKDDTTGYCWEIVVRKVR